MQHFPVCAGVENGSVENGFQCSVQRGGNYMQTWLICLSWNGAGYNLALLPFEKTVMRFKRNNYQSYFALWNVTAMFVWFIHSFALDLVDWVIQSLIHSIASIQLINLPLFTRTNSWRTVADVKWKGVCCCNSASLLIRAWKHAFKFSPSLPHVPYELTDELRGNIYFWTHLAFQYSAPRI